MGKSQRRYKDEKHSAIVFVFQRDKKSFRSSKEPDGPFVKLKIQMNYWAMKTALMKGPNKTQWQPT
jgi:hypothetical protein